MITSLVLGTILLCPPKTFTFAGKAYVHRFSQGDLHEFTPKDQLDLNKFGDMLTLNLYKGVRDWDGLAKIANAVLENYKTAGATAMRTNSVPQTASREAEHFVAVFFVRPTFSEAAFARFRLLQGLGASLVYSHRIYGSSTSEAIKKWLVANGTKRENELMALKTWPLK